MRVTTKILAGSKFKVGTVVKTKTENEMAGMGAV